MLSECYANAASVGSNAHHAGGRWRTSRPINLDANYNCAGELLIACALKHILDVVYGRDRIEEATNVNSHFDAGEFARDDEKHATVCGSGAYILPTEKKECTMDSVNFVILSDFASALAPAQFSQLEVLGKFYLIVFGASSVIILALFLAYLVTTCLGAKSRGESLPTLVSVIAVYFSSLFYPLGTLFNYVRPFCWRKKLD